MSDPSGQHEGVPMIPPQLEAERQQRLMAQLLAPRADTAPLALLAIVAALENRA